MKHVLVASALAVAFTAFPALAGGDQSQPAPAVTATGIPLDAPWKVTIYQLARKNFIHPAWGWQHSERNYKLGLELAAGDGFSVDTDILFAACFLHDMAAFSPYQKAGMEHGDRAAEVSVAVLRDAGFPMEKVTAVQAAERGHMYYSDPGKLPEAIVLHDADSLDFLGDIAAARMFALIGEKGDGVAQSVKALRGFVKDIPPKLITRTGRALGARRARELEQFLDRLEAESFGGKVL